MRPKLGHTSSTRVLISPGALAPISTTATWVEELILKRVYGTPIWLFRFPSVATTLSSVERTVLISSLVVVLPFVPVSPITGILYLSLLNLASCCSATRESSTNRILLPKLFTVSATSPNISCESTTATAAPFSRALRANLLPSNVSPFKAKNIHPGVICLESVQTAAPALNISQRLSIISSNSILLYYLPVEPNPPAPLPLSSRSSTLATSTHSTLSCFATTICAILSPGFIVNTWFDRFTSITFISPL